MLPSYIKALRLLGPAHLPEMGTLFHAVEDGVAKALCSRAPSLQSRGWDEDNPGKTITCPKCLRRLKSYVKERCSQETLNWAEELFKEALEFGLSPKMPKK